jgi:hypothetical protein
VDGSSRRVPLVAPLPVDVPRATEEPACRRRPHGRREGGGSKIQLPGRQSGRHAAPQLATTTPSCGGEGDVRGRKGHRALPTGCGGEGDEVRESALLSRDEGRGRAHSAALGRRRSQEVAVPSTPLREREERESGVLGFLISFIYW